MKKSITNYFMPALLITAFIVACSSSDGDQEPSDSASHNVAPANQQQQADQPYSVIDGDTVWTIVDDMPLFSGGDSALLSYLAKNTTYPKDAAKSGTEGRCIVRFCVTGEGDVDKVSIIKGVSPQLDAEAIRVVASLPKFEYPGIKNGKPVSVWYMVPIQFKLN